MPKVNGPANYGGSGKTPPPWPGMTQPSTAGDRPDGEWHREKTKSRREDNKGGARAPLV